ncbi:MAG: hypothetical protein QOI50_1599 [Pseudonocardiales bacterium]|jgi:hypothetical protein|uniref:DUF5302 domain-containing protein n=1 Tax=Pseudonocardia sp. Cha107L01 TaxID=3457576 RepID=UPI0028C57DE6|nr:hypothetical protein [Pseudonocardiales bacterium]HEV7791941.1 DUF5302 domain-containing protein [Pseudonocardia sp.]MDT7561377.1 hypothetical protein [Pseudonocardiales bacterium]MDT7587342.1 hypothetical protein [Pseudonocardiales bacterium]MDT7593793.1 hypothetical protein [Pseudonocardiales bacterium]
MPDSPKAEEPRTDADATEATPDPAAHADELKDRFRAALDRKRGEAKARSSQGHGAASPKVGEAHRKAGGKRTFRRKSG